MQTNQIIYYIHINIYIYYNLYMYIYIINYYSKCIYIHFIVPI